MRLHFTLSLATAARYANPNSKVMFVVELFYVEQYEQSVVTVKEICVTRKTDKMTLDDSPLENADGVLGYKLRMAQILAFRAFEERLTAFGRAPRYLGLLAAIRQEPGLSQNRLAQVVALGRSSLVSILDQLETDGLLERKPAPGDRRRNGVWLTTKGNQTVDALLREALKEEAMLTRGLTASEVLTLKTFLDIVIDNLRSH